MQHHSLLKKLKNLHLLYIEDDPQVRSEISEFLKRYFILVEEASSAEEAMILFEQKKPDIILVDINLPGKSGLNFSQDIRKHHHDVRIIISTAYTDKEFFLVAVELELTRYLVKPITGEKLLDALEKASDEYALLSTKNKIIYLGEGFEFNKKQRTLRGENQEVSLRPKELELLEYFISHSKELISYTVLEYEVWRDSPMSKDAIRSQIRNLRRKTHNQIIKNVSGIGYRLYQEEDI